VVLTSWARSSHYGRAVNRHQDPAKAATSRRTPKTDRNVCPTPETQTVRHPYTIRDYYHFFQIYLRNNQRQRKWGREFEAAVRGKTFKLPAATVVQLIPTEACNLRCPFCNQWGENGYFLNGARHATHMDEGSLMRLMRCLTPRSSLISVHGGEPFAYKHTGTLLQLLREQEFDVMFSTNGTLLTPHLKQLARIRNLSFLLSIDGDEETHDRIRGRGRFKQAREAMASLFELRRIAGLPLPLVIMSIVVCEWTTDVLEKAYEVAREFNAFAINYNFRWFLTKEVGEAYEAHLQKEFGLKSSGAWRGWVSPDHEKHDYSNVAGALQAVLRKKRHRMSPPFVVTTPSQLRGRDYEKYFTDYLNTFGNESCFMPFYWARVHANGDLIFCPGHPDVIAGNVFRDGFMESFNSGMAVKFRKHNLNNRLPICNRCCGLYMTNPARPVEQKARRRLGLPKEVTVHYP
jgi:MoaA/NifB/PqqE/SkfB family radical SAM enzyme